MLKPDPRFRSATPGDARSLAELVNMAGEGLPLYLWQRIAQPGQSAWEIGCERARRKSGSFTYRNAVVRLVDDEVVACLIGYPLEDQAPATDYSAMPPMFVPLQQLEDLAPGTWYVNVLATRPELRGRGYGRELLAVAESLCRETRKQGLSLIVADSNAGARRLYQANGYREIATRAMVKEGWQNPGREWILMRKDLPD
jgi:ribosomal protein S18 acetylase RimI-like enzyme